MKCALHQTGVGVIEHRAVHNVAVGQMIESISADLPSAAQNDVVAPRDTGGYTQRGESGSHGLRIVRKKGLHRAFAGDETPHDVSSICKDGTATAFATNDVNPLAAAEIQVNFSVSHLIAPHDDGRVELPREKIVVFGKRTSDVLFCC